MAKKNYVSRTVFNYTITGCELRLEKDAPILGEETTVKFMATSALSEQEIMVNFQLETKFKQVVIKKVNLTKTTYRMEFEKFIKESEVFVRPKSQRKD